MHRSARYQARGRRSRSVPAFQGTQTHSRTPPPHCRRLPQAAPVDEGRQIRHPHPKFLMAVWLGTSRDPFRFLSSSGKWG